MTQTTSLCLMAVAALMLTFSCSRQRSKDDVTSEIDQSTYKDAKRKAPAGTEQEKSIDEETKPHDLTSIAAQATDRDGMKFIRTADIKFQVDNVPDATYQMEDITAHYGGFITYTDLHSTVDRREVVPASPDSSLEVTWYTVQNDITLRLPNTRMDSALRAMTALVGFLDHRVIRADEVSGQLLSNELSAARNADHTARLNRALDDKQVRSQEVTDAANAALAGRESTDNARLTNRALDNQIKYSTLHFVIYQRESRRSVLVANDNSLPHYEPSFLAQLRDAAVSGWEIIAHVVVFVVNGWAFVLIGAIAVVVYRRREQA